MATTCASCGQGLSFAQRARGRKTCDPCVAAEKAALAQALSEYDRALAAAVQAGLTDGPAVARLRTIEGTIAAAGGDFATKKEQIYRSHLDAALADDRLTEEEEHRLLAAGDALFPGSQNATAIGILRDYRERIFVAMVNDGRLPQVDSPSIMLKRGEILHLVEPATLVKEVIQREFHAGTRGMSFRVTKGVSYRVGSVRGKMVEVGRSLEAVDTGELSITSHRAVFTGERKSIEVPYAKLLDLNVYTDAIQLHVSGRQTPSMLRVSSGPMVAATINAAMQRLL